LTYSDDNTARVWNAATGAPVSPPLRDNATPNTVLFAPDGYRVLVASPGRVARLWGLISPGDGVVPAGGRPGEETSGPLTVKSPDGQLLVVVNTGQAVRVRRAVDQEPVSPPLRGEAALTSAAFSPDGARVATGDEEGNVQVWDAHSGKPLLE